MSTTGKMARRTSPLPASLPDSSDLLREILLRLPPRPSSLPRASLVCKRWHSLVADPRFKRRFRDHHGKPPLLGFFLQDHSSCPFVPVLDPPDRIPGARFSMSHQERNRIVDCRHGLVLFLSRRPPFRLLVWDPVAREQRRLISPPELDGDQMFIFNGAVLRPAGAGDQGHFQVALIARDREGTRVSVCLYSSETGVWSNINSLHLHSIIPMKRASTLIGNSLCWLLSVDDQNVILEFDLDEHSLAVTELPAPAETDYQKLWIMPAEDGGLGFIHLSEFHAQLWKRKPDSDGLAVWVLERAMEFRELRSICKGYRYSLTLVGFDEDSNAILVLTASGVFMVYLQSMEFKKLSDVRGFSLHYPFASFYHAGTGIGDVHGEDEVLNNM